MSFATERQELHKKMLEIVKDDVEQQLAKREQKARFDAKLDMDNQKHELARQMKADGMHLELACKYTGHSAKDGLYPGLERQGPAKRVAGGISPPAPTPPYMRVRIRRFI